MPGGDSDGGRDYPRVAMFQIGPEATPIAEALGLRAGQPHMVAVLAAEAYVALVAEAHEGRRLRAEADEGLLVQYPSVN